eukprot:TRINITY_DN14338_c0_g1_i1.p1 TRINITY_DN14338_c0_g1~~TRINITY_DN14338_c0_g1_i1.p1  ORF type:complete len:501 (-),score=79.25 TRINITY_DN14338_c0_g1_i1:542-2044(-)
MASRFPSACRAVAAHRWQRRMHVALAVPSRCSSHSTAPPPSKFDSAWHSKNPDFSFGVVGAGIMGLATAYELLLRYPEATVAVFDRDSDVAGGLTGATGSIVYCGCHFEPGTLRARLCVEGNPMIWDFCSRYNVPHQKCGLLLVAPQRKTMVDVYWKYQKGIDNGVPDVQIVGSRSAINLIEPSVAGMIALWSPTAGVCDFGALCRRLRDVLLDSGRVQFFFDSHVVNIATSPDGPLEVQLATGQAVNVGFAFACAGSYSDVLAAHLGLQMKPRLLHMRNFYYMVRTPNSFTAPLLRTVVIPAQHLPRLRAISTIDTPPPQATPLLPDGRWFRYGPFTLPCVDAEGRDMYSALGHAPLQTLANLVSPLRARVLMRNRVFLRWQQMRANSTDKALTELMEHVPVAHARGVFLREGAPAPYAFMPETGLPVEDFLVHKSPTNQRTLVLRHNPTPGATACFAFARWLVSKGHMEFKISDVEEFQTRDGRRPYLCADPDWVRTR